MGDPYYFVIMNRKLSHVVTEYSNFHAPSWGPVHDVQGFSGVKFHSEGYATQCLYNIAYLTKDDPSSMVVQKVEEISKLRLVDIEGAEVLSSKQFSLGRKAAIKATQEKKAKDCNQASDK